MAKDAASSASSALSSASAFASAAAADALNSGIRPQQSSRAVFALTVVALTITALAGAIAAIYFSGVADDLLLALAKKYYMGKASAEAAALGKLGEGAVQAKAGEFLKDQLKKNPMMGADELEGVQKGLGSEALKEGLGGVSSKLGGLGKF